MKRLGLLVLACAGCSRDIRLGELPDAAVTPFIAGTYTTSFLDPAMQSCSGTLAGHEADFAGITRATTTTLLDGTIDLSIVGQELVLSGTPIQSGFPQSSVTLTYDPGAGPPPLWDNTTNASLGSGPDSTQIVAVGLALDSSTAIAPSGIQGEYVRVYMTPDTNGQCGVAFGALLVRN